VQEVDDSKAGIALGPMVNQELTTDTGGVEGQAAQQEEIQHLFDLGSHGVIQQGQIITEGQVLELVAADGQTYHIKLDNIQGLDSLLTLPASSGHQTQ